MFWGLSLKANKKYTQTVQKPFHVSQAALDITNSSDDPIQVILSYEKSNYILCTLRKGKTEQVPLDLNFAEGDEVSFTSQGGGNVHLVGYFMTEPEDIFGGEEEDSDEEDMELPADIAAALKGKAGKTKKATKEMNKSNTSEEASDDDDDSEDGDEDESDDEDDDDDDDDEEGDEEEEEADSDSDEEDQQPKKKQIKLDKSKESLQNGKAPSKEKNAQQTPKQQQKQPAEKSKEKTLQGGVKVEDVRVGNGQEARPGKKVQVYYEGRLKSNNKVFDSSKQGGGFKFTLGRGEVIKGWDIGVAGMKIGGKRVITCPPNMAYGQRGSPPVIPPNSTLVFEVELKGVH